MKRAVLSSAALALAACSGRPAGNACAAAQTWAQGRCAQVCSADADCPAS